MRPLVWTLWLLGTAIAAPDHEDADLRQLLQNYHQNQDLIANMGTAYEIVYPFQIRQDWIRGLSTRIAAGQGEATSHLPQTTFVIETVEHKFHLDLELNTNLLAPTLVQFLYLADSHTIIDKIPENCYYHATLRNHPGGVAALRTCNGLSGVMYLKNKIFIIHPLLHGNQSRSHPHLLYHYFPKDTFMCANEDVKEDMTCSQETDSVSDAEIDVAYGKKFVELALVIDQSMFEKQNATPKEVIASAVQIINCADLLFRPLNTSLSLVYLELWTKDQVEVGPDVEGSLDRFHTYVENRLARISVDAAHLLTGYSFEKGRSGLALIDSICTSKAVGLSKVDHPFEPHLSSYVVAHGIGHNLAMHHDRDCCLCSKEIGCIMEKDTNLRTPVAFSRCSVNDYYDTLRKGYGACLFNMPTMRTSVCGNGILEKEEQCDCGTSEECVAAESCCDPISCRLIKHAQCSSGACCRKCKLLSPDHMCRPTKGECDIPEFCDGVTGQCPVDLYKKNGQVCGEGFGYCYLGACPVTRRQCQDIWGSGADSADAVCFERLNVLGTPNGNCGSDGRGGIAKCSAEDAMCGSLQCNQGEKEPVSGEKPVQFVVNKINADGTIHECKSKSNLFVEADMNMDLVKDGTKCGFQKLCVNRTCTHIRSFGSGSCPVDERRSLCSGHGVCTNLNTCHCEEGWTGADCEQVAPDRLKEDSQPRGGSDQEKADNDANELKLNANLAITVIAASIIIGLGLVTAVILIFLYGKTMLSGGSRRSNAHK